MGSSALPHVLTPTTCIASVEKASICSEEAPWADSPSTQAVRPDDLPPWLTVWPRKQSDSFMIKLSLRAMRARTPCSPCSPLEEQDDLSSSRHRSAPMAGIAEGAKLSARRRSAPAVCFQHPSGADRRLIESDSSSSVIFCPEILLQGGSFRRYSDQRLTAKKSNAREVNVI